MEIPQSFDGKPYYPRTQEEWAKLPIKYSEWLETEAGAFLPDLDVSQAVTGHCLGTIVDDVNCFPTFLPEEPFNRDTASQRRKLLEDRLMWRATVPGLPEDIRKLLAEMLTVIEQQTWQEEVEVAGALNQWKEMKDRIKETMYGNKELLNVIEYEKEVSAKLVKHWEQYLKDNK